MARQTLRFKRSLRRRIRDPIDTGLGCVVGICIFGAVAILAFAILATAQSILIWAARS